MASAALQQGAGHARSEITHAEDPRHAAADGGRDVEPQDRGKSIDWRDDSGGLPGAARGRAVGGGWPLPEDLSDVALEARLFPASTGLAAIKSRRTRADWPAIHRELKRPGVKLRLLWEGHRATHPEGYGYRRVC